MTAGVEKPALTVSTSLLERVLAGGFTLHLELGQVAPSSTDVSVQKIGLVRASDQSTVVAALLVKTAPLPPYHLEPGGAVDSVATVSDGMPGGGQRVTQAELDALCKDPSVQISATLSDTASGKPTPVASPIFDVTGCP